jgi:Tfp pilus assembly protein PilV
MNRTMRVCRARALTLVEVMVAAAVLALAVVGMIQVVVVGSEMLDLSRKQTIAAQIIHGQIDLTRLRDWAEVEALDSDRTVAVDAADQAANISEGFVFGTELPKIARGFACRRVVSIVRTDMKQITFTVTWTGGTGRTYSRSGSTYVGRNGLYVTYQRS